MTVRLSGLLVAAGSIALFSGLAQAVSLDPDSNATNGERSKESPAGKLEEIIVTAQRRTENLQDVPVSAQVVGGQKLAEQNFVSLVDLSQTLPGVHIATEDASNSLFIRGVGSQDIASLDQSVSMFSDDIYHGRSRMSTATFLDLDRIEVLKGPQTTFFGNNAIAGALNLVSKKPGETFEGWARALYGQFGQYALEGAVGGPLSDTLGARIALTRNGVSQGWIDNVNLGEHVPHIDNEAGRLILDFHPNETFDASMKAEGSKHRTSGTFTDTPYQYTHNCPPAPPVTIDFGDIGLCSQAIRLGVPIGLEQNNVSELPGQFQQLTTFEDVLTVNSKIRGATLTSVSGYYSYHFDSDADGAWLPIVFTTTKFPEHYHQFSQELRVASPLGGAIEYMAGAYFQTDDLQSLTTSNDTGFGDLGITAIDPYLPFAFEQGFSQSERVYSVFGSLTWNATDRLKVSGSLRGSSYSKDFFSHTEYGTSTQVYGGFVPMPANLQTNVGAIFGLPPGPTPNDHRDDRALMPSVRVQYKIKPDLMGYFRYDRGFKPGGFSANGLGGGNQIYGPEHVNAYELGLKSTWLDDTVLLNVDVFRGDYRDRQLLSLVYEASFNGYSSLITNAAASRSQGVEIEGQWAVTQGFRLSANATYLDAYYVDYKNASQTLLQSYCSSLLTLAAYQAIPACLASPYRPPIQDLSGHPTDFSPKWSGSLTATYSLPLPRQLRFITELSPYFSSSYFLFGALDDPRGGEQGGYTRLDARLALEAEDGHWSVGLIGKNLTDHIIISSDQIAHQIQAKEMRRNVALQLLYRF